MSMGTNKKLIADYRTWAALLIICVLLTAYFILHSGGTISGDLLPEVFGFFMEGAFFVVLFTHLQKRWVHQHLGKHAGRHSKETAMKSYLLAACMTLVAFGLFLMGAKYIYGPFVIEKGHRFIIMALTAQLALSNLWLLQARVELAELKNG